MNIITNKTDNSCHNFFEQISKLYLKKKTKKTQKNLKH